MHRHLPATGLTLLTGALLAIGCSAAPGDDGSANGAEALGASCALSVTQNSYDGPNYWGTVTVKNTGASTAKGFTVDLDLPDGAHCTNDAVPAGATLSPLSGSGSSAATTGSHCTFTFASATIAKGATKTINYSTDSSSFSAASKAAAHSASCGSGGGSSSSSGGGSGSGSGGSSGGGSGSGGSSGGGSGSGSGGGPTGGKTINGVYITWYGFNDNSCQVESQHNCNTIAYPKSAGFPVHHEIATEGTGTYDDPSTFATASNDAGTSAELLPGTLIYVPEVRKYFIMEDQCFECGQEWAAQKSWHVDLWMGPSFGSNNASLMSCEDKLTLGSAYHGTGEIIVNPPSGLPVDTTTLFANDQCTAHTY